MVTKTLVTRVFDGSIDLPEEALKVLPANTWLRVMVDPTNGTVCIHADPPPGQEITEAETREAWFASWGALHQDVDPDPMSPEEIVRMFKETRARLRREEEERAARGSQADSDAST